MVIIVKRNTGHGNLIMFSLWISADVSAKALSASDDHVGLSTDGCEHRARAFYDPDIPPGQCEAGGCGVACRLKFRGTGECVNERCLCTFCIP